MAACDDVHGNWVLVDMTFPKKYGYSSTWSMVINAWLSNAAHGKEDPHKIKINIKNLILSDFTSATILISFGAFLGKTSRLQLIIIAILEVIFAALNETILVYYIVVADVGGSMIVHLFGAYFGVAVAYVLKRKDTTEEENPNEAPTKTSDMFSLLGKFIEDWPTIFLWLFWPSFNGAMLGPGDQQQRAIINTYISLASCCTAVFFISPLLNKKFKLNMVHVQNATLAGGVAVGAMANLQIKPWGAMLIGIIAGVLCTLGYEYVTPMLQRKIGLHDTCGVHNLHGMPGILSAIGAAIAAYTAELTNYENDLFSIYPARAPKNGTAEFLNLSLKYTVPLDGKGRSNSKQAGMQLAAMFCSLVISIIGGAIAGLIVKHLDNPKKSQLFDDKDYWIVPSNEDNIENGNSVELIQRKAVTGGDVEEQA
eukprot:gene8260-9143_t